MPKISSNVMPHSKAIPRDPRRVVAVVKHLLSGRRFSFSASNVENLFVDLNGLDHALTLSHGIQSVARHTDPRNGNEVFELANL